MPEQEKEHTISLKQEIADETAKLVKAGKPEFLASIQAAGIVHARHASLKAARAEALATSCNEA